MSLSGKTVAILAEDGYEDLSFGIQGSVLKRKALRLS